MSTATKATVIETLQQFDNGLREIAKLNVRIAVFEFKRKEAIIAAENNFAADARALASQRDLIVAELEKYYRAHRAELEKGGKKSVTLQFGRAGIKKGQPQLRLLKPWKWGGVLELFKRIGRTEFIRQKDEIDKNAVKAAKLPEDEMARLGLKFYQSETFFVETFPEDAAVTTAEATRGC